MSAALILIDLQRGVLKADTIRYEDPDAPDNAVAVARALLQAARKAKVPVVHIGVTRPAQRSAFDAIRTATARKTGRAPRDMLPMKAGTAETEFLLDVAEGEEVIHKMAVSAFSGTRLDTLLRCLQVSDVVVGGAFTHMAVESSARQGFDLGYRMLVVGEACCAPMNAVHAGSLNLGVANFAEVLSAEEAIALLAKGASVD